MAGVPLLDRCPGVLRPHQAEDGLVVRLRIPGGQTTAEVLRALCGLAAAFSINPGGAGYVQLTSRGNLQLRGLDGTRLAELTQEIFALGLLPSFAHDRVRNIVASPLTGLSADRPDLRPMVGELDAALCADPALAELPGRFLFALDDGRGDVASLAFDLGYRAVDDDHGLLVVGGPIPRGRVVARREAVPAMIDLAREVVRRRASAADPGWRVWDLPGLADGLAEIALPGGAGRAAGRGVGGGVGQGPARAAHRRSGQRGRGRGRRTSGRHHSLAGSGRRRSGRGPGVAGSIGADHRRHQQLVHDHRLHRGSGLCPVPDRHRRTGRRPR